MKCHKLFLFFALLVLSQFCYYGTVQATTYIKNCTSIVGTTCYFGTSYTITSVLQYKKGIYPTQITPPSTQLGGGLGTITSTNMSANGIIGNYDYWLNIIVGSNNYIYQFYYSGGWTQNAPIYPTGFTRINVSTTTQTVNIKGWWNATTTTGITERLFIYQNDLIFGLKENLGDIYNDLVATTTGAFNFTYTYRVLSTTTATTTTPITSTSTITAFIYKYDNNYAPDIFTGLTYPNYKILLDATSTPINSYTGYKINSIINLDVYPEYECGITSMTGCIKNGLIWAFYPTKDLINQYYDFIEIFQSKAPFGYISIIMKSLTGINASSTSAFTINIPTTLKTMLFTPLDIAIASILWIFFLFNFYKRIKHITI